MTDKMTFNLLTVTGKVKTPNVESTRQMHNQTAGNPDGVAAAKSLGDMSHMTYMPLDAETNFKSDLMFLDIWNSVEGLQKFFSDKQVIAGGDMMFSSKEAVVWSKLESFLNFQFPAPTGKNDRVVGIVRGKVKSIAEAETAHNAALQKSVGAARANGLMSHDFYNRLAAPGSPEALEVLGVDIWMGAEGMMKFYTGPDFQNSGVYQMFAGKPASSTWIHPKGEWVEW
jgi:hypothetical protein